MQAEAHAHALCAVGGEHTVGRIRLAARNRASADELVARWHTTKPEGAPDMELVDTVEQACADADVIAVAGDPRDGLGALRDLRIVVAALRVSASLERMGDIAEHIAQLTRMRFPERAIPKGLKNTFTKMGELDVEAVDMGCLVVVGASTTRVTDDGRVWTPRSVG